MFCTDAAALPITEYLAYFKWASPCSMTDAAGWEYPGRLLTPADAQTATGDDHFQAPALVEKNGNTYLLVTPVDTSVDNRYNGCRIYEFDNMDTGRLAARMGNRSRWAASMAMRVHTRAPALHTAGSTAACC